MCCKIEGALQKCGAFFEVCYTSKYLVELKFTIVFMKRNMDIVLIILAALVPMLVALNSYRDSKKSEKEAKKANEKLSANQGQLNKKQDELNKSLALNVQIFEKLNEKQRELNENQEQYSNKIIALQNELRMKQNALQERTNEVVKIQQENLNELTGGDSFCTIDLRISKTFDGNFEQFLFVRNHGKYLLRGVTILIDVPLWSLNSENPLLQGKKSGHHFAYGPIDIPAFSNISLGSEVIPSTLMREKMTYIAQIQIPKGFYKQFIRLALIKGLQYRAASKIDNNPLNISYQSIDPLFPKEADGKVEWRIFEKNESPYIK
jgi:uncharacterized membrane-anchored protein YhcB (DUF1043 family)